MKNHSMGKKCVLKSIRDSCHIFRDSVKMGEKRQTEKKIEMGERIDR